MSVDADVGALRSAVEAFAVLNRQVAGIIGMNPLDLVIRSGREAVGEFLNRRDQAQLFGEWSKALVTVQRIRGDTNPIEDGGEFLVMLAAHLA